MKPQMLALAEYFNSGSEVTHADAWNKFGIQNLTARLSELMSAGFAVVKNTTKIFINGRHSRLTAWKFRDTFCERDHVQVVEDIGTLVSLKGRTGQVQRVDLHKAQVCVYFPDVGFRSLKFHTLKRIRTLDPGTLVGFAPGPYVVLDYHPETDSYSIQSPSVGRTLVAHAALLRITPC